MGADYRLIAGERRWRAAQLAGLHEVPAVVRDVTAAEAFELALVENLQRTDLNPLEEAEGYRRLIQEFGLTQDQVGERVGRDRTSVANALRLLQLPDGVKDLLASGALGMGHARALLGMGSGPRSSPTAERIVREQLSVRETERLVRTVRVLPRRLRHGGRPGAPRRGRWWRTFSDGWGRRCDSRIAAGRARWRSTSSRTRTWSVFSRCCGGEPRRSRSPRRRSSLERHLGLPLQEHGTRNPMAVLKREEENVVVRGGDVHTLLGKGSEFEGKLTFEGQVRIDGKFSGQIFTKDTLVIGEGARVNAEINAGTVIVNGVVEGNVRATQMIELHTPGRVKGNLETPSSASTRA